MQSSDNAATEIAGATCCVVTTTGCVVTTTGCGVTTTSRLTHRLAQLLGVRCAAQVYATMAIRKKV